MKIQKYNQFNESQKMTSLHKRGYWTEKKLQEEVDKYENRMDFKKNNSSAYIASVRKSLLDKLFKNHLNNGYSKNISGYWTKDQLQDEVNKYKTRTEFYKNNCGAYDAAFRKKLLDELFKNHSNKGYSENRNIDGYWTEPRLQEEANKYKTRAEFSKNKAYGTALKMNIIDKLFKNHINNGYSDKQKISGYWTEERLQDEVNKYENRNEFNKNNTAAYNAASKKNLIDKLFKNHTNQGYMDKEEWKENSYIIYAYELEEFNSVYIGLTNDVKRRDKEHLFDEKEKMALFCKENNIPYPKYKILEEDLKSAEAQKQEKYWVDFYENNGWKMFNIAKTGGLGGSKKWTKKSLQEEVNKYQTIREFRKNNSAAYGAAAKKKIIEVLFKNHSNNGYSENQKIKGYWTKERVQDESSKYKNRADFYTNNTSAYNKASKMNILNDLFKNHPNNGYSENRTINGYWTEEQLQDEANKYINKREFKKNSYNAYLTAKKRKILDILFKK